MDEAELESALPPNYQRRVSRRIISKDFQKILLKQPQVCLEIVFAWHHHLTLACFSSQLLSPGAMKQTTDEPGGKIEFVEMKCPDEKVVRSLGNAKVLCRARCCLEHRTTWRRPSLWSECTL